MGKGAGAGRAVVEGARRVNGRRNAWQRLDVTKDGSAPWPAADQCAVPDDDDALGRGLLACAFSIGDLLGCWGRTTDDDEAVADLGLVHGGVVSGAGPTRPYPQSHAAGLS